MTGPLSSSTWNLSAPTGCPSNTTSSCASYPPTPPVLPGPTATPGAGAGISGVNVYITTTSSVESNGIPSSPLASGTTNGSGSYSISLPYSVLHGSSTIGIVAVNGASVGTNGTTNLGFTIAHAVANVATHPTLYLDSLDGDEQSAFVNLNIDRAMVSLPPMVSDTIAQAVARLAVAQRPGAATSTDQVNDSSLYSAFGGVGSQTAWGDTAAPQWYAAINYGSPWSNAAEATGGFAALYNAAPCGTGYVTPINYFAGEYVSP